jgi:hypothetical protein
VDIAPWLSSGWSSGIEIGIQQGAEVSGLPGVRLALASIGGPPRLLAAAV